MRIFFVSAISLAIIATLVFAAFSTLTPDDPGAAEPALSDEFLALAQTDFSSISGWLRDDPTETFAAYLRSCEKILARPADAPMSAAALARDNSIDYGLVGEWAEPCRAGAEILRAKHADAGARRAAIRGFFEGYFVPFEVAAARRPVSSSGEDKSTLTLRHSGKFTGYFEPEYPGRRSHSPAFSAPILSRPSDLIEVDLGLFRDDLAGRRIAGRAVDGKLARYPAREAISSQPDQIAKPLAWLSPVDLFFMQIQGSGRVRFEDGTVLRFGYAAQNGRDYTAIGRALVEQEIMPLEDVSMQSIRAWLEAADETEASALLNTNESYVFFQNLGAPAGDLGPPGAQEVALTPGRSLAVDLRFHVLGAPLWVRFDSDNDGVNDVEILMIAQDTGGAIKGPVRGDVFWGSGPAAGEIAGRMNAAGEMVVFLPRPVAARISAANRP